ncbi:MAG: hypothetical protein SCH71_15925 [Desulfobulbaceae bacterium]|nr:hypothetical protein [Desulfobulbaceae bacterium]
MNIDKKQAAKKAAAMHSTNLIAAAIEYARLTEQIDSSFNAEKANKFRDELLSFLPVYRHPSSSIEQENGRFLGDLSINLQLVGWSEPEFIRILKEKHFDDAILSSIKEYVRDAEIRKCLLLQCEKEREVLCERILEAENIYKEYSNVPSDKRNTAVVQVLGFSSGNTPKIIDKKKVYIDYLNFVRKEGMSREEATDAVQKKYRIGEIRKPRTDVTSDEEDRKFKATLKHLIEYRKEILGKLENDEILRKGVKKYTRGLILPRTHVRQIKI